MFWLAAWGFLNGPFGSLFQCCFEGFLGIKWCRIGFTHFYDFALMGYSSGFFIYKLYTNIIFINNLSQI